MAASFEFEGMDTLTGILHNLSPRVTPYLVEMMTEASYEVFNISQEQVPVRYGVLKGSGHVEDPVVGENGVEILIGYGGPAAQYALFVHENLTAEHAPPTKAKFLEDPMNDVLDRLIARLQGRMEGVILGQYPQAPAQGVTREAQASIASTGLSTARLRQQITHSPAMSINEVHQALRSMRHGG